VIRRVLPNLPYLIFSGLDLEVDPHDFCSIFIAQPGVILEQADKAGFPDPQGIQPGLQDHVFNGDSDFNVTPPVARSGVKEVPSMGVEISKGGEYPSG
jgi:hypothetical protein